MASESNEPSGFLAKLLTIVPVNPISPFWPVIIGIPVSLVVYGLSRSQSAFGGALIALCAVAAVWEVLVLAAQNRAIGRPSPELIAEHQWLRGRTFAWAILLVAVAGVVLVSSRLVSSISSALVPTTDFALTEVVVLGLTIGILALLTRYTAISSYVESSRLAASLKSAVNEVNSSILELKGSIQSLSAEIAKLRTAQGPRPRVDPTVVYRNPQKKIHVLYWRVAVSEAKASGMKLLITVNSSPRVPVNIGDLDAGQMKEAPIGSVDTIDDSGVVSLTVSYADLQGTIHTDVVNFGYSKEKGFWGGIKNVRLSKM